MDFDFLNPFSNGSLDPLGWFSSGGGSDDSNTTNGASDYNAGLQAMADAQAESAKYMADASVATAGLQSATQIHQANILYLIQHEDTEAGLDKAHLDYSARMYEIQTRHDENVRESYIEYRRMLNETGQDHDTEEGVWEPTYNPDPLPPRDGSGPAGTGDDDALGTVEDIVNGFNN